MTQEHEIQLVISATLFTVFLQEHVSRAVVREIRTVRLSLSEALPRMRHNKTMEPLPHE